MKTNDLGRLYTTRVPLRRGWWPILARTWSVETDPPFRVGRGIAVRVDRDNGRVIGWWGPPRDVDEETAILEALRGREVEDEQLQELDIWYDEDDDDDELVESLD